MKSVIIISDSYHPEKTSSAKLLKDLTDELLKRNKRVTILTTGKENQFVRKKNLHIIKSKVPFIQSQNFIVKFIGEIVMPYIFIKNYSKNINYSSDLLICYSPSIFFKPIIDKVKLFPNSKKLLLIRDIFPDWLVDAKILSKNSFRYKLLKYFQSNFYNSFDVLCPQSDYDKKYIEKIAIKKNVLTIKNWIKLKSNKKKNIQEKKNKKIIFGGNIGIGQDMNFIIELVKVLNLNYEKFKFYLVGTGRGMKQIKHVLKKNELKNFYVYKKLSQKNYINFLNSFDLGVISLNKNINFSNFPGKLLTYLECNLPILAYCSKNIELYKFIRKNKIGISTDSYKPIQILNSLKKILNRKTYKKRNFYINSQKILRKEFSVEKTVKRILEITN